MEEEKRNKEVKEGIKEETRRKGEEEKREKGKEIKEEQECGKMVNDGISFDHAGLL